MNPTPDQINTVLAPILKEIINLNNRMTAIETILADSNNSKLNVEDLIYTAIEEVKDELLDYIDEIVVDIHNDLDDIKENFTPTESVNEKD